MEQYLTGCNGQVEVSEELKAMVRFEQFDLGQLPGAGLKEQIDIVFACCELVHFDRRLGSQMISLLHLALRNGGYLVLGSLESLQDLRNGFRLVHFPGGFAYRKLPNSG